MSTLPDEQHTVVSSATESFVGRAIEAIYEDGVVKPLVPLDLPSGTHIRIQVTAASVELNSTAGAAVSEPSAVQSGWLANAQDFLGKPLGTGALAALTRGDLALLLFGMVVYALTRFVGLTRFPIYFFSDEAVNPVLAEHLLHNGLRDGGVFLPPYFKNDDRWTLSLSVYVQLIGVLLSGKSVLVTRALSAVVSLLGAVAVALTLKLTFRSRCWWLGTLVMAALPAWFLHSRTAFETVLAVSFYACFLCAYLLYRYESPRYLMLALVFGAATFYSYANGQGLMLVSGVLLLLSDLRYHLRQQRQLLLGAALLAAVLAGQYVRFRVLHPEALTYHLQTMDSYWLRPIPLGEKLATFGWTYLAGLSPAYWFFPNQVDLARHQMKDFGHLSPLALPFVLVGLGACLWRWRSSAHRAVLIAVLAAPFSASLVGILIPRVLAMVVPAALLVCIGLDQIVAWVRGPVRQRALVAGSAAVLCLLSFAMLRAALVEGPTWFNDYNLYGMQYGAQQVFSAAADELSHDPSTVIFMSPSWANNPDVLAAFFLTDAQRPRLTLRNINYYLDKKRDIAPTDLFVLPANEEQAARESGKLVLQPSGRIIPYPDGQPGFYFVRMRYSDAADALFAADAAARVQLKETHVELDGQQVGVRYSDLDMGQIADLFDQRPATLIRGHDVNPLVLEFSFATPRTIGGLRFQTATMNLGLKLELTAADGSRLASYSASYRDMPPDPEMEFTLPGGPQTVSKLRIEFADITPPEEVYIHVRELSFR